MGCLSGRDRHARSRGGPPVRHVPKSLTSRFRDGSPAECRKALWNETFSRTLDIAVVRNVRVGCENSITLLTWEFTGRLATPQWALPRLGECVLRLVQRMGFAAELEDATRPRTRRCRTCGVQKLGACGVSKLDHALDQRFLAGP